MNESTNNLTGGQQFETAFDIPLSQKTRFMDDYEKALREAVLIAADQEGINLEMAKQRLGFYALMVEELEKRESDGHTLPKTA